VTSTVIDSTASFSRSYFSYSALIYNGEKWSPFSLFFVSNINVLQKTVDFSF
jgi:hypothetical protein